MDLGGVLCVSSLAFAQARSAKFHYFKSNARYPCGKLKVVSFEGATLEQLA
jgi:hypothetical protein